MNNIAILVYIDMSEVLINLFSKTKTKEIYLFYSFLIIISYYVHTGIFIKLIFVYLCTIFEVFRHIIYAIIFLTAILHCFYFGGEN